MEKKVSKIDEILEKENYWCVDYFPERIEDWDKFKRIESYLLKPAPKRRYISKVINIVFKIVPYFDAILYIGDTYKRRCRRYEGIYEVNSMNPQKLKRILSMLMKNEEVVPILLEPNDIVLYLDLYNMAIYVNENRDMSLFEDIVKSEGLFLWKDISGQR